MAALVQGSYREHVFSTVALQLALCLRLSRGCICWRDCTLLGRLLSDLVLASGRAVEFMACLMYVIRKQQQVQWTM